MYLLPAPCHIPLDSHTHKSENATGIIFDKYVFLNIFFEKFVIFADSFERETG